MLYTPETYQIEKNLVHWCKTGQPVRIPGTRQKGLQQYRRLLRNNFNEVMKQAFPIARTVLPEAQWDRLIDDFMAAHPAATPQIWKLPREFYHFVKANGYGDRMALPFLNDLLHFEWIEIAVHTMPDQNRGISHQKGDPMKDRITVNPEHRLIRLSYPVHLYAAGEVEKHKGDYFVLTFRRKDFEVLFMDLPPLHAFYFEQIVRGLTFNEILSVTLQAAPGIVKTDQLKQNLLDFVQTLFSQEVFLGYREEPHSN